MKLCESAIKRVENARATVQYFIALGAAVSMPDSVCCD